MHVAVDIECLVCVTLLPLFLGLEVWIVFFVSVKVGLEFVVVFLTVFVALVRVEVSHGESE